MALIATVGLLLGSVAVAPTAGAATRAMTARQTSFDAQMIGYINQARTSRGLAPLREASGLTVMSAWWSQEMLDGATGGNLAHNPDAWTMVLNYGASNRRAWGENVGKFETGVTARDLFTAYMNSPKHKANILSPMYHYIGMGTVGNSAWTYNSMEFTDQVEARTIMAATPLVPGKTIVKSVAKPARR